LETMIDEEKRRKLQEIIEERGKEEQKRKE
jgi:hypothetical protein